MDNRSAGFVKLRNSAGIRSVDYYLVIPVLVLTIIGLYVLQKVLSNGYAAYPGNYYRQIVATLGGVLVAVFICLRLFLCSVRGKPAYKCL